MLNANTQLHRIVLILSAVLLIVLAVRFWPLTADDAFITFRYSRNMVEGFGPTFNQSGERIEGYTTFLWMVLMTLPHGIGMDAVLFSKIAGIACVLAVMLISYYFVLFLMPNRDPESKLIASAAPLMIATYSGSAIHGVAGMETPLYMLLMTTFLFQITRMVRRFSPVSVGIASLAALLMSLTRPEGNLVAGVGLLAAFFMIPSEGRLRFIASVGLIYLLPAALYFIWRMNYYGELLPLPFYIKVAGDASGFALRGWPDVVAFGSVLVVHIGLLIFFAIPRIPRILTPALLAAGSFVAFFFVPAHVMGFDFRFLVPVLPFLMVLSALGLAEIADWMRSHTAMLPSRQRLMLLGAMVVIAGGLLSQVGFRITEHTVYAKGIREAHTALGKRLAAFDAGGDAHVLAAADAGAIPYYSRWHFIDTFGLNEPHIALTGDHSAEYVFSKNPEVVVLISQNPDVFAPALWFEQGLYDAALDQGMDVVQKLHFHDFYYLWVMVDPDTDVGRWLSEWEPNAEPES